MFCRVAELGVLGSEQPAMDLGPVARFAVAVWVAPFNVCSYLIMSPVVMAWPEAELIEPLGHTPRQVGDRFDRLEESLAHAMRRCRARYGASRGGLSPCPRRESSRKPRSSVPARRASRPTGPGG